MKRQPFEGSSTCGTVVAVELNVDVVAAHCCLVVDEVEHVENDAANSGDLDVPGLLRW